MTAVVANNLVKGCDESWTPGPCGDMDVQDALNRAPDHQFDTESTLTEREDPNLVDFEGVRDPENPLNWSPAKKTVAISLVSLMVMISHTGSTISSAIAPDAMADLDFKSHSLGAFVTTVYLMGYASGPILIAPLSELYGRLPLYRACIVLAVVFHVACAVADSIGSLVVLRLLAGVAASSPLTLAPGTIADIFPPEKRGPPMAAFVVGAALGQAIGPILGGYLVLGPGWRWTFWFMAIASGVLILPVFVLMNESYPLTLLENKTRRLRRETGNVHLRSALEEATKEEPSKPTHVFARSITRPLRMLLSPIVLLISLYVAVVYSYIYLLLTTFPRVFKDQYGFDSSQAGLATLGMSVGSLVGVAVCGTVADRLSVYLAGKKNLGTLLPEYRLPTMTAGGFLVPIGLFWYAWTAEKKTSWIAPVVGTGFLGAGLIITYMASTMYLVDAFTVHAASAAAASTILRCLCGALLPLAGDAMYDALGTGWGTSLLGFISIAFLPVPAIVYRYGQRMRERSGSMV